MKSLNFVFTAIFFLAPFSHASNNYLGKADDRAVVISISPDKASYSSGGKAKFSGTISVTGKKSYDWDDFWNWLSNNKKKGLLEEFQKEGIEITGSFPSSAVDVSSALKMESNGDDEIKFSFESQPIVAGDLNQLSLRVYNNSNDKAKLKLYASIQAKLERRLVALRDLKKYYQNNRALKEVIAVIEREIESLSELSDKIEDRINSDDNLIVESIRPIQVDNLTGSLNRSMTSINGFRFSAYADNGVPFEGLPNRILAKVSKIGEKDSDDDYYKNYGKFGYLAELYKDGSLVQSQVLDPKTAIANIIYNVSSLSAADQNKFELMLYRTQKAKKVSRIGSMVHFINVLSDKVNPIWLASSLPNLDDHFVLNPPNISLVAGDSYGRINPGSLIVKIEGKTLSGQSVSYDLTSSLLQSKDLDGAQYTWSGAVAEMAEGDYYLTAAVSDTSKNVSVPNPYKTRIVVDRTVPKISFGHVDGTEYQYPNFTLNVSINDVSPVSSKIYLNDVEIAGRSGASFQVPMTLKPGQNKIKVVTTDVPGNQSEKLSNVVYDITPPVLSFIFPDDKQKFYTNAWPIPVMVKVSSNEALSIADVNGTSAALSPDFLSFTWNLSYSVAGVKSIKATAKDIAGNQTIIERPIEVVFDATAPVITISYTGVQITKSGSVPVSIVVQDATPVWNKVFVNDIAIFETRSTGFDFPMELTKEGSNTLKVVSTDSAGNSSTSNILTVVRDTTPPVLTINSPAENDYVKGLQFSISASSNEQITSAKVNGTSLSVGSDKVSITGKFTTTHEGALILSLEATDVAGNIGYKDVTVRAVQRALVPDLLSIVVDPKTNKLIVKGAIGATRSGITVKASGNLFNSGEMVADKDGAFAIPLDPFSTVEVSAYDPIIDRTDKATLKFGDPNGNLLAGSVRDIDGQPLVGAKVSLANSNLVVFTDADGVFKFTQSMANGKSIYGDQDLIVDGRTISQGTGENQRKFSIVHVSITISLNQSNVLQRPIYLAPVVLDGTETQVATVSGGTVISPHAPGVQLDIPANSTIFPDGSSQAAISMQEIPADKSTILPVDAAMPNTVVALEPSGTTFSQPVTLKMPNKNEFPADAELVVLLMNSKTGKWEVGGSAVVNGDTIETKPGQGIRHFSLAYVAPVGPTVMPVGAQDKPGANTFDGAVTSKIPLPTFKSFGQNVSPTLMYKSSWAKPTVLVTNLFDMSTRKVDVTVADQTGTLYDKIKINLPYCSLKTELFGSKPTADDIKCVDNIQEFLYNIQYKISYKNTQSVITPEKIVASFESGNIKSIPNDPNLVFTGVPDMAAISYGMELKDSNSNEYMPSGVYPYTAHYDIHYKQMTVGTRRIEQKVSTGEPQISEGAFSSDEIQKIYPQDLIEPMYVQNYSKSEAGRGWRISGVQRIVNPSGDRIMIEEQSGDISTYSLANTINTLADLNGKGDLNSGVGLNGWPFAHFMDTQSGKYKKIDLTSMSSSVIATPYQMNGGVSGFDYFNWTRTDITQQWECLHHDWTTSCDRWGWKYYYNYVPTSSCSRHAYSYSIASRPAQFFVAQNGDVFGLDYGRSSVFAIRNGTSTMVGGRTTPVVGFGNNYQVQKNDNNQQLLNLCNSIPGMNCNLDLSYENGDMGANWACGATLGSGGEIPDTTDLNNPMGMTSGTQPNTIVIADSGHHQIKLLDLNTGISQVIAGSGRVADNGNGIPALQADIYYPRGVVYDNFGNLYISSKAGLIRRVDTLGNITTIAGDPINGQLLEEGDAKKIKLIEPYGMVFDSNRNYLYVAETGANRVMRIDLSNGHAKAVAGNRTAGYSGDGKSALEASLNAPTQLGLDPNGNLLIADTGNQRIRRVVFQSSNMGLLTFNPTNEDNSILYRNADGTWNRVQRSGITDSFDINGLQTQSKDQLNRTTQMSYDELGRLIQVTDAVGQKIEYFYAGSYLSKVRDPAGRETSFSYNSDGYLIKVNYPDNTSLSYDYNEAGLLVAETNQRNLKTQYIYNLRNRLEKIVKPDETNLGFADGGSATSGGGNLQKISEVKNTLTDSNGNQTSVTKDFNGDIYSIAGADGKVTTLKRDSKGRTIEIIRPDGTVLQNTFDQVTGDLLKVLDTATGQSESKVFDTFGHVIQSRDSNGNVTINEYSPDSGLLVRTISPGNRIRTYAYNHLGLLSSETSFIAGQNPVVTQYEYNEKAQLIKKTNADGAYVTFNYDGAGNIVEAVTVKENGIFASTKYFYSPLNRLLKVITPNNETTEYSYLSTGELSQIKDPNGKISSLEYDQMGRVVKKTDALGNFSQYSYDPNGNVTKETDPNGSVKAFTYNANNKVTQATLPDDLVVFQYNDNGELLTTQNKNSKITYTRSINNKILSAVTNGLGTLANYPSSNFTYDYDGNGNLISVNSNFGSQTYQFDELNRPTQVQTSSGSEFNFAFDDLNRLTRISRPGSRTDLVYSAAGLVNQIIHSSNGVTKAFNQFSYDQRNFPIQRKGVFGVIDYSYDLNGQLTKVLSNAGSTVDFNESFAYDSIGNRITDQNGNYSYDQAAQRLNEDYLYIYYYDNNGNLTSKASKDSSRDSYSYSYSSTNQLIGIKVNQGLTGPLKKEIQYAYDALGRRMQKIVYDNVEASKSYTRKYIYNGDSIVAELDSSNTILANYVHSPLAKDDMLEVEVTSAGAQSGLASSSGKYQYLKDTLGTITDIADSNGNIVQRYSYSAFGKILKIIDENSNDITIAPKIRTFFSFTGREWDDESGLYYYRARYYDPGIGRFMQQDPYAGRVESPVTFINKYIYTGNTPTLYRDPSGKLFGIDDLLLAVVIGALVGAVDVSLHTGDFLKILEGALLGAVAGFGLWLTAYIVPASNFFGLLSVPSQALGVAMAVAPAAYAAGQKGGSFVSNFELNVVHGDTIIAAGLAWMGDLGRTQLAPGLASADLIERSATVVLTTFSYLFEYAPGISEYCNGSGESKCK